MLFQTIAVVLLFIAASDTVVDVESGLRFLNEPPSKVAFVNTKGAEVECTAAGNPVPTVRWIFLDGSPVTNIAGLREVTKSGGLFFRSFKSENFRPDVHSAAYRCVASNGGGVIHSRNVNVHGVVFQNYEVLVYDSYAIEGNTAVFKCHVPAVVVDYVDVVSWIKNDNLLIQPSMADVRSGKFAVMPTGELYIRNVTFGESGSRYKCKTSHRLTDETQISATDGQLFVTESRGLIAPKVLESTSSLFVSAGESAVLGCVAQGNPPPAIRWFKKQGNNLAPVTFGKRYEKMDNAMIIGGCTPGDSGVYVCEAKSDLGKEQFDVKLVVTEPVAVKVEPSVLKARVGEKVRFECVTNGKDNLVSWLHNGVPRRNVAGKSLEVDGVQMSDRGMYQCFVKSDGGNVVQASAELKLTEMSPDFAEVFEEVTLNPANSLTLKCVAIGIPLPSISWNVDGILLKNTSKLSVSSSVDDEGRAVGTLVSNKLDVEDGGVYSCVATSNSGESVHSARVNVYGSLGSRNIPPVLAVSGGNMFLNCPVYGYPLSVIKWEKDKRTLYPGRRLKIPRNGTLIVETIDKSNDAGSYKCYAQADKGQKVEGKVDVTVMVAPQIVPFAFQDELLREGMRARLQCVVSEGDVPLSVSWLKDGTPLVPEQTGVLVRELDEFSSILTINSIVPGHNGKYTCVASNRAATVTHTAELSVNVPPKLVPFSFQDEHVTDGQLARVSCIVSRGDLPLRLAWEKDGVEIPSDSIDVQIKSFDDHSSILSIVRVSPENNGVYTCVAANEAGTARHSAQLTVNVPPKWIVEPEDVSILRGESGILHCSVQGYPEPKISWMRATDGDLKPLIGSNVHLYPNGSVLITNVDKSDEGYYSCTVSNGVGNALDRVVAIKVSAPPIFKQRPFDQTVSLGKEAQLQCQVQGDAPIKISWFRNGKPVPTGRERFNIETTNTDKEVLSLLTIHRSSAEDSTNYECIAENSYGTNNFSAKLTVVESPSAPKDFNTTLVDSRTVELSWRAAFDGNDPIKRYIIQYKLASDSWDNAQTIETVNGDSLVGIVAHLQPATSYIFCSFAENGQGRSPRSNVLHVTTLEDAPSGVPVNVEVDPVNVETLKVHWNAPEDELWNGRILGYYVGYKAADTDEPYLFKPLMTREPKADDLSVQIGGLKKFTKYAVVVLAYNSKGRGPQSQPVVVMTSEGVPTMAPSDVRCTTLTSRTVHVTWAAPPLDTINGILRGYNVIYRLTPTWFEDFPEMYNKTLSTSLTLTSLEKYKNYSIEVLAFTRAGDSPRSAAIFCKTLDDVPEPPSDIKAVASSENSVTVSWKVPENFNGVVKSYTVYWKNAGSEGDPQSSKVSSALNFHEVVRLKKGMQYEFWVTGSTLPGEGQASKIVRQAPGGPRLPARILSFDEKVIARLNANVQLQCLAVGNPSPQRKWHFRGIPVEGGNKITVSGDGMLMMKDVQEDSAGEYSCSVQNEVSQDKITYTVIVLSPPSSVNVGVLSVASNAIEVQWKAPVSKMLKIKGYTVKVRQLDGDWKVIELGPEARGHKINSLNCGTNYEVNAFANNSIGTSVASESLMVTTNGSVPLSPSKSDLIEETSSSVSLYLNTWKSNGCPIQYYVVEYAPKSTNEWSLVSNQVKPDHRRLVIPNLRPGTWYGLRMTAHNGAGSSVAKYDFATLTSSGATISPELQADAPQRKVDSLMAQLNFYLIVPVVCTAVILLAILGVACMCIKIKRSDQRRREANQRLSSAIYALKRGDSFESVKYYQHGTMSRPSSTAKHAMNDITPYATLQLTNNHGQMNPPLAGHCMAPPLPPPRFEGLPQGGPQLMNASFFSPGTSFMVPDQSHMTETTFIFANQPGESPSTPMNSHPSGYQNADQK